MVIATFTDGRQQSGSGFLVGGRLVLTAEHCTRDILKMKQLSSLRVIRSSDGAPAPVIGVVASQGLDVAVLRLGDDAPWDALLPAVAFARVERHYSGMLQNCEAIGYPLFQRDAEKGTRDTGEVHGTIYQTDEAESGRLLIRETRVHPEPIADWRTPKETERKAARPSPWGGFSGALLFHAGLAIGVVVEHHHRQGDSALKAMTFDRIARDAFTDPAVRGVADALGLPGPEHLMWAAAEPVEPLAGLVELLDGDDLPQVRDLNPYRMGATPTWYGNRDSSGVQDPYVPRTHGDLDVRLREKLVSGRMVVLVGPSKAGKTRTAFEAIRSQWPEGRLLAPAPPALHALAKHPRLQTGTDEIIVWLDDLQEYLISQAPLTPALLTSLLKRPGPTMVLATLRSEERARLALDDGEFTRDVRRLLEDATQLDLRPTSEDPIEQKAARDAYPGEDLSEFGLAEQLAGAPALLRQYRDARDSKPVFHKVIQVAIDWTRVGMPGPVPVKDLAALALNELRAERPEIRPTAKSVLKQIAAAATPPKGAGRVATLRPDLLPDGTLGYSPFSYLLAADDGQIGASRPIPAGFWDEALKIADPDAAYAVSQAARRRQNSGAAIRALKLAADAGHVEAMYLLGTLLQTDLDPPDLEGARYWYEKAANAGHTSAMLNLGVQLAHYLDPPDFEGFRYWSGKAADAGESWAMMNLGSHWAAHGDHLAHQTDVPDFEKARYWYERAANAGNTSGMDSLGTLLAEEVDPPDLNGALYWYEKAAEAGNSDAMCSLADLLADEVDPPDLNGALNWYKKAAEAGNSDAMFSLGALAYNSDPRDIDEARYWLKKAAHAGNSNGMGGLGYLLGYHQDPPDNAGSRYWLEKAADAGNTAAMNLVATALARVGDAGGARALWERITAESALHTPDTDLKQAALSLAALDAFDGNCDGSIEFLDLAGTHGAPSASTYAATLSSVQDIRDAALLRLSGLPEDSDALNFLGIDRYLSGERAQARQYWARSSQLGDTVAPLLLHLIDNPPQSTRS
ncbi:bifunctional trypsin-like peptidase domain-containing/SEL1-like repeat protein [Arthrobacter sp. PsM3]|uniref:bifunctional trypsin-like peptidase domain-containing/SEL1-like repeat protein n=1 Tax=Arthrobacter sp. PsM3 TaxID=3030531 RepID=UPI00263A6902|nr:bifunctional trypsin-like peptidase domain-containing/SEL1-like repeat protein [Arthrobacter sp. PsM3]MDN4646317.1 bifunctional trypsin-like peptidase domain-containing/SEL1-like repeat protein [Arthrobacter sp. PsM3]